MSDLPPTARVMQVLIGAMNSAAVSAIARLGVPDHLQSGPKTIEELAHAIDARPELLFRLLLLPNADCETRHDSGTNSSMISRARPRQETACGRRMRACATNVGSGQLGPTLSPTQRKRNDQRWESMSVAAASPRNQHPGSWKKVSRGAGQFAGL